MNVKEFKEFLKLFGDNELIISAIQEYIKKFGTNTECEIALQTSFDRLKKLAWKDKHERMVLTQQLKQTSMYLKGEMYKDEEYAKQMLSRQIENIDEVLKQDEKLD